MLEPGSVFLHFILGATICNGHHHLGNIPPHPVLHREGLLICVLECHPCDRRGVIEEQKVKKEDKQELGEKQEASEEQEVEEEYPRQCSRG